jgi:hypothetical protein
MTAPEFNRRRIFAGCNNMKLKAEICKAKGIPPTAEQLEVMACIVDELHEIEAYYTAHQLDKVMCDWSGLLLDA